MCLLLTDGLWQGGQLIQTGNTALQNCCVRKQKETKDKKIKKIEYDFLV
jgi:hypothetical protein